LVEVTLTTTLACTPDKAWTHLHTPALLQHIAWPIIRFVPKGRKRWPKVWGAGEKHRFWMWLFGVVPLGWQAVVISEPAPEGDKRFVRDNGYGPLVKRWDHLITVAPGKHGQTVYTDRVIIDAGIFTPLVRNFAIVFFTYRQRRWRELAESNFRALRK
jgi:hypothetical protein